MVNDPNICDHTSVGVIVFKNQKILLIERNIPPYGFAPPAGHVDSHGTFKNAAKGELKEEVGLKTTSLELVGKGLKLNKCSRKKGNYHFWKIYKAKVEDYNLNIAKREVKQAKWFSKKKIRLFMKRTQKYLKGDISDKEWQENPGLEIIWYKWFKELNII